ncbi:metallophosphoesterase [Bacteroidota bacterium]
MNKLIIVPLFGIILLLIDLYVFQAFKVIAMDFSPAARKITYITYWGITGLVLTGYLVYNFGNPDAYPRTARAFMLVGVFMFYFAKIFALDFLLIDDVIRLGKWVVSLFSSGHQTAIDPGSQQIPRSEFLAKTAIIAGIIPFAAMGFGIISGAHDYRIRRKKIYLSNLPKEFHGLRIGQLSDIHSGSFWNKKAVTGGVEMFLNEKPDVVFFTGDLVNTDSSEISGYINVFNRVKAPLGVYSTLGNHDYGDYRRWPTQEAKMRNLEDLKEAHRELGWDLLMNENRYLRENGEKISIIGIENWGAGRFSKYGKLSKAYNGSDEASVKLLLSHDPSHWDAQVRLEYPDIDIMFAGHTHGFQFGVEIGDWKWSPSQWAYKQWAGLYQEDNQYLYVNRGFGYIGYPGRIGILPELTIVELLQA